MTNHRTAALWLMFTLVAASTAAGSGFTVVDRREVDGSVLVVPRTANVRPGSDPFVAATGWNLTIASDYFRVKSDRIRARRFNIADHIPATTFADGNVVANSLVSSLGGSATKTFEAGEIVRLTGLNTAFNSVRMDLAAVCRRGRQGDRWAKGRVVFVLSGQVGTKTLAEANLAVSAELEPVGLQQVVRQCDPKTGEPPFAVRPGLSIEQVVAALGVPISTGVDGELEILEYAQLKVYVNNGRVERMHLPALD